MIKTPFYTKVLDGKILKNKSNNNPHLHYTLMCEDGNIAAKIWDAVKETSLADPMFPQQGEYLKVIEIRDDLATHQNIKLINYEKVPLEAIPGEFVDSFKAYEPSEEKVQSALELIFNKNLYSDIRFYELVYLCWQPYLNNLKKYPAAKSMHHAYSYGLLIHTAEVLRICMGIAAALKLDYQLINEDILYSSASTHDCGKFLTYSMENDVACVSTEEFDIGHLAIGYGIVKNAGDALDFDKDVLRQILHCLAAHHETVEKGTIKPPRSIEALVLANADNLSATCGIISDKLRGCKGEPPDEIKVGNRYFTKTTAISNLFKN